MLPFRFSHLGFLFAAGLSLVLGQEPRGSFEALKQAVGLSDAQVVELQQNFLRNRQEDTRQSMRRERKIVIHFPEGMDDSHRARLSEIAKVLDRAGTAAMAIDIGLIRPEQWPVGGKSLCYNYPFVNYASSRYLSDFGMTGSQIQQLAGMMRVANEPLWAQVREKAGQRQALLNSGLSVDSPAVIQLGSDSNRLSQQVSDRPPRDLVISVLDSTQKAKVADFEKELNLARQALELGLIFDPNLFAEVSCK